MKHWFFRTNFHVLSRYRIGKMTMLFLCLKRKVQIKAWVLALFVQFGDALKFRVSHSLASGGLDRFYFRGSTALQTLHFPHHDKALRSGILVFSEEEKECTIAAATMEEKGRTPPTSDNEPLLQVILLRIGECINAKYCHRAASARQSQAKSHSATHR